MSHVTQLIRSQGVALVAILLVLTGGAAYAAGLAKNSVKSSHIKNGKVKTVDLKNEAVTGAKIEPASVPGDRLIHHSVTGAKITSDAVTPDKILDESLSGFDFDRGSLHAADLAPDNVGSRELKAMRVVVTPGTAVPAGGFATTNAFCAVGEQVIGGGFAWQDDEPGTVIVGSTPDTTTVSGQPFWSVRGGVVSANKLFAWGLCIPA